MGRITVVECQRGITGIGPVTKLVESAEVCAGIGKNRERVAAMYVGNAGNVPSAQELLQDRASVAHKRPSFAKRQFIQIGGHQLVAHIKSRGAIIRSWVS